MLLWRSGMVRLVLALAFMLTLVPTIGNTAGAAGQVVEATVTVGADTYDPNDTVAITVDLQNNAIRRMRADVELNVVDPDGSIVRKQVWQNVRATTRYN